jgi:hypothetical protein
MGDELRIEAREPIPWHRDRQLAGAGQQRLAAVAVAPVLVAVSALLGQMVVHLGVQRPLGEGALQLVQDPAFRPCRAGVAPGQELVQERVREWSAPWGRTDRVGRN